MADKEKLSAFMDGELVDNVLIQELEHDSESLGTWKNYHLIGDVMRGDTPQSEWNIAESVALALEHEPVHRSFTRSERITDLHLAKLEAQPKVSQARRQLPTWFSQLGQVAIAASVSLAVIIGVQQYGGNEATSAQEAQLPVLQTVPFAGSAEPVSLTRDSVARHGSSEANMQEQRRRINALLQDYELQLRLNSENLTPHPDPVETVIE
ncbi:RseA family anti-sigma factor [Vibrio sp.]|uniref:RseA family anti-sigma factor n=1 Tax=Vibrio sp. TaxID=678 RepID=UPI003D0DF673